MPGYTNHRRLGVESIDDSCNVVLLPSDIDTIFDQKQVAIVPRSFALTLIDIAFQLRKECQKVESGSKFR